jgi:hypothetical protein
MALADAKHHAHISVVERFRGAPKIKINSKEYKDILEVTYMISEVNTINNILRLLDANRSDPDLELIIGDLEMAFRKTWEDMRTTNMGRRAFREMSLEDVMARKGVGEFLRKRPT